MAKILMSPEVIEGRGTTASTYEYASYLGNLGHSVCFSFDKSRSENSEAAINFLKKDFKLIPYIDFHDFARKNGNKFDYVYYPKAGDNDGKLFPDTRNYIHAVFQWHEPHGEKYAYISKWLAESMYNKFSDLYSASSLDIKKMFEYIPHIVDMPSYSSNIRKKYGIPESAFLGCRLGGYDTFDLDFVHWSIEYLASKFGYYFIFVNTKKFSNSKNIIFINSIYDKQLKADILGMSDYFIHARREGESFGVAIVEALQMNLPVLTWQGGSDRNHIYLVDKAFQYKNRFDLVQKIRRIRNLAAKQEVNCGKEFRPEIVMKKFLEVFPIN
jgi:hypothetical protein